VAFRPCPKYKQPKEDPMAKLPSFRSESRDAPPRIAAAGGRIAPCPA